MDSDPMPIKPVWGALVSVSMLELVNLWWGGILRGHVHPLIITAVVRLLQIHAMLFSFALWGTGLAAVGLFRSTLLPGLWRGAWWSAFFIALGCALYAVMSWAGIDFARLMLPALPPTTPEKVLFFAVGGMLGPVAEEILFRGILYGFLRKWGVTPALLISTALFALSHSNFWAGLAPHAVGGLVLALIYEKEGNLLIPITIHSLGNMALFSLSIFATIH